MESHLQQVESEFNSTLNTNCFRRKMISNIFFNNRCFLNTHLPFNGDKFKPWKARFKIFVQSFDIEL